LWARDSLKNIRLSGGEPTVYKGIVELVKYIKSKNIERIAMSTNGYADLSLYKELIEVGVNDFSISLDACCSAFGDMMAGGINGAWEKVISNIKEISKLTYVTVGCVVTEDTVGQLKETIEFASSLGVSDIRIISSAQYNTLLENAKTVNEEVYRKYPILKYRIKNLNNKRNVRGLKDKDSRRCGLVLDDMAIAGDYHFPCIIYMREGGNPIGKVGDGMRQERKKWFEKHNSYCDEICKNNCLDVCIDYNNKYIRYQIENFSIPKMDSTEFTFNKWRAGSIKDFNIPCRWSEIISGKGKNVLKEYAVGWCYGENLMCRPKENEIATMFYKDGVYFWFHLRANEFYEVFKD
jgi:MoaA/NifB/PqqE/SkfB family radical SAM enzyme